jgi:NAD(P)-dependent dehydrogenase (short-subunit alcohol dehydrogenase family)
VQPREEGQEDDMSTRRVALVTGANRGIGLEIARQLAAAELRVLLGCRDPGKSEAAVAQLAREGLAVSALALDVSDPAGIGRARSVIEQEFGRLDVLVNNAGILIDPKGVSLQLLDAEILRATLETNLIGAMRTTQALLPLMLRGGYGRIVNLSSGLGQLEQMQAGTPAYRISKTALNALTRILAAELAGTNVKINAMCPGWVRTDMGGAQAERSVEEGADTALWLATLADDGPSGGFFRDRAPIPW